MAVYKQPKSKNWWYKFTWNGALIRESTKQTNKRVAEQIEASHKTSLAKGELGIRDRKAAPTVREFAESAFLPHVETRFAEKTTTLSYYRVNVKHLTSYPALAKARLNCIPPDALAGMIAKRRDAQSEISSINRTLQVFRRMLHLAVEWGTIDKLPLKISLLPGEKRRERVLTKEEERAYLKAAHEVGEGAIASHAAALTGIRATQRGDSPIRPTDPFLLQHVALVLLDCGLRPEECYRLRLDEVREGNLHIAFGKTQNARRIIPMTDRVAAMMDVRRTSATTEWMFEAPTASGHITSRALRSNMRKRARLGEWRFLCRTRFVTPALLAGRNPWTLTLWRTSPVTAISEPPRDMFTPRCIRFARRCKRCSMGILLDIPQLHYR